MTQTLQSFDSQHDDMIHDVQVDYYGKRVATCSSDRTIRIHAIEANQHRLIDVLRGHEGAVWQCSWAHPRFGTILASGGYDGKACIWKDQNGQWIKLYEHTTSASWKTVNSVQWSPQEHGLHLACGSSDGRVVILTCRLENSTWFVSADFAAHHGGCNAVSWAPSVTPSALVTMQGNAQEPPVRKLASAGCDNTVKVWTCNTEGQWLTEKPEVLNGHTDWVRDVAWAPNIGMPGNYIASCSQDKSVLLWSQSQSGGPWLSKPLKKEKFTETVWRVSWSLCGTLLAVSSGDNKVSVWKENMEGVWEQVSDMEESSTSATAKS